MCFLYYSKSFYTYFAKADVWFECDPTRIYIYIAVMSALTRSVMRCPLPFNVQLR